MDYTSHYLKKFLVDLSAIALTQPPAYAGVLYLSGADFEEALMALPVGFGIVSLMSIPFGYFQDKWRNLLGGDKPVLYK